MVRRSRKKRPSREDYMLKEQLKIEEGIFDERTMLRIGKLFSKGVIASLEFIIARGKEADVYLADGGEKIDEDFVVMKVFRLENSRFQNRMRYITGDPRFGKVKGSIFSIVNEWCKKEYGNLLVAQSAGVHAPKPYAFNGNALAMEFIGIDSKASRPLRETKIEEPEKILNIILDDIKKLYKSELIHADMSEYNILMRDNIPYLIDFGQAVHIEHPEAKSFLERDLRNMLNYFRKKYQIDRDFEETYKRVTG